MHARKSQTIWSAYSAGPSAEKSFMEESCFIGSAMAETKVMKVQINDNKKYGIDIYLPFDFLKGHSTSVPFPMVLCMSRKNEIQKIPDVMVAH
ncbi:MAG: hypothetical protein R2874_07935 [Desulfobacterales bacterium]